MSDDKPVISDEAVKAAAKRYYGPTPYGESRMRRALEAAAPHMLREAKAEAWDEAAASIIDEHGNPIVPTNVTNPYRSQA